MGEWEPHTTGCEAGHRDVSTTRGIQPTFCSNCTWKVTFKTYTKILKMFLIGKKEKWAVGHTCLWVWARQNEREKALCGPVAYGPQSRVQEEPEEASLGLSND